MACDAVIKRPLTLFELSNEPAFEVPKATWRFDVSYQSSPDRKAGVHFQKDELVFQSFVLDVDPPVRVRYAMPERKLKTERLAHGDVNIFAVFDGEFEQWDELKLPGSDDPTLKQPRHPDGTVVRRHEVLRQCCAWATDMPSYNPPT